MIFNNPGISAFSKEPITTLFNDAERIYSLRKVLPSTSVTHPIKVRRSSDNLTLDIPFDANGHLNETALLSHVGTSVTDNGYVTEIREQVFNTESAVQTTANDQPKIVDSGLVTKASGRPSMLFSSHILEVYSSNTYTQPNTIMVVGKSELTSTYQAAVDGYGTERNIVHFSNNTGNYNFYSGSHVTGGISDDGHHVLTGVFNSPNSKLYKDGVLNASGDTGNFPFRPIKIGGFTGSTVLFVGLLSEVIFYNSNKDLTNRTLIENNLKNYHSIP